MDGIHRRPDAGGDSTHVVPCARVATGIGNRSTRGRRTGLALAWDCRIEMPGGRAGESS